MTYFLPVLLMCLADGCKFYADPPQASEAKCQERLEWIKPKLENSEVVKAYQMSCIQIQLGRNI
jgi:hypothetical protein